MTDSVPKTHQAKAQVGFFLSVLVVSAGAWQPNLFGGSAINACQQHHFRAIIYVFHRGVEQSGSSSGS